MFNIGKISSKYESGGDSSAIWAEGSEEKPRIYFGRYQITDDNIGNFLDEYVKPVSEEAYNRLAPYLGTASQKEGEFSREWVNVAKEGLLENAESKYIKDTHYLPQLNKLGEDLRERIEGSKALQSAVWSTVVQHGANTNVIEKAWEASDGTDKDFINKIYEERRTRFPRLQREHPNAWNNMMTNRFGPEGEEQDVLNLLEEKPTLTRESLNLLEKKEPPIDSEEPPIDSEEPAHIQASKALREQRETQEGMIERGKQVALLSDEDQAELGRELEEEKQQEILERGELERPFPKHPVVAEWGRDPKYRKLTSVERQDGLVNFFIEEVLDESDKEFFDLPDGEKLGVLKNFVFANLELPPPERSLAAELVVSARVAIQQARLTSQSLKAIHADDDDIEKIAEHHAKMLDIQEKMGEDEFRLMVPDILEVKSWGDLIKWATGVSVPLVASVGSIIVGAALGGKIGGLAGTVFFPGAGTLGGVLAGGFVGGQFVGHQMYMADLYSTLIAHEVDRDVAIKYANLGGQAGALVSLALPGGLYAGFKGAFGKTWVKGFGNKLAQRLTTAAKTVPITAPVEGSAEFAAALFQIQAIEAATGEQMDEKAVNSLMANSFAGGIFMGGTIGGLGGGLFPVGNLATFPNDMISRSSELAAQSPEILQHTIETLQQVGKPTKQTELVIDFLKGTLDKIDHSALTKEHKQLGEIAVRVEKRSNTDNIKAAEAILSRGKDLTHEEAIELSIIYANNPIYRIHRKNVLGQGLTEQEIAYGLEKQIIKEEDIISKPSTPRTGTTADQLRSVIEAEAETKPLDDVTIKDLNKKKFSEIDRLKKKKDKTSEEQEALKFLQQTKDLNAIAFFFQQTLIEPEVALSEQSREELEHRAALNEIDTQGLSDEQIRQAIINVEALAEPKYMRITEGTEEFTYSEMEKQLSVPGVIPKSVSVKNLISTIQNLVKKGKIKKAEVEDSGIIELLGTVPRDQLTRDEALEVIRIAEVQMEEVVYSEDVIEEGGKEGVKGPARHRAQTAQGEKTDYREIVFTLPLSMLQMGVEDKAWRSDAHFPDENVTVFMRVSDRKGPDGKKIFFIEEIQSDWMQRGRKFGFTLEENAQKKAVIQKQLDEVTKELNEKLSKLDQDPSINSIVDKVFSDIHINEKIDYLQSLGYDRGVSAYLQARLADVGMGWTPLSVAKNLFENLLIRASKQSVLSTHPGIKALDSKIKKLAGKLSELDLFDINAMPKTQPPMKATEQWAMLAMKRAIFEAAQDGYDQVSWADGDVHVRRWGQKGLKQFYDKVLVEEVDKYIGKFLGGKKGSRVKKDSTDKSSLSERLMDVLLASYNINQRQTLVEIGDKKGIKVKFTPDNRLRADSVNRLANLLSDQEVPFLEKQLGIKKKESYIGIWTFPITPQMKGKHPRYLQTTKKKPKVSAEKSLVEKTVKAVENLYKGLGKIIEVIQKESSLPAPVQASLKKKNLQGKVYGVAYGDKIYIIANNLTSEQASDFAVVDSIVRHEGRHILFQKILGGIKAAEQFFTKASIVLKGDVQAYLEQHRLKDTLENRRDAAEEILADMAKTGKVHKLVDQLLVKLAEWIRKIPRFANLKLTNAELRKLVADADASMATGFNQIQESDSYIYSPKFMRFVGTSVAEQLGEKSSLNNALGLKKEGKTPREVWKKTGWFEVSKNDWYFYLPDKALDFSPTFFDYIFKGGIPNAPMVLSDAIKDIDSYKIMKLYPFLKDLRVKIKYVPPPKGANKVTVSGAFHIYNNGMITLYLPSASWMKKIGVEYRDTRFLNAIRNTLSHELQHGIQHEEKRQSNFPGYVGIKSTGTNISNVEKLLKKDPKGFEKKYTIYRDKTNNYMRGTLSRIPLHVMKQLFPKVSVEQLSDMSFRIENAHLIPEAKAENLSDEALEYQRTIKRDLDTLTRMDQGKEWWDIFQERIEGQLSDKMDEDITSGRELRSEEEYVGEIIDSFAYPIYAQTTGEIISRTSGTVEEILVKNPEKDLTNIYPGDLISKDVLDSEGLIIKVSDKRAVQGIAVSKKALYQNMDEALEGTLIPGDVLPELEVVLNQDSPKVTATAMMENRNEFGIPIKEDLESSHIGSNESMKLGEFKTNWIKTVFSSVSDVFRQMEQPWANEFADRIDNYYNSLEQRLGEVNAPFYEVMKTIYKPLAFGGKGPDAYFKDFSEYYRHMDWGRTELAQEIYDNALPETRTLIDQAKKTFDEIGDKNLEVRTPEGKKLMVQVNDMYVWDQQGQKWIEKEKAGHIISELQEKTKYKVGWRPIRKIKKGIYFPRKMRSEIVRLKSNPELDPGLYNTVIDSLSKMKDDKGNLRFSSRDAAEKWFKSESFAEVYLNDYHANIEKSRRDPLPEIFYEYSWNVASDYFYSWAKRVAQVETYGQDVAGRGDYFDRTLKKIDDSDVRDYAIMTRDAVYEAKTIDKTTKYVGTANMIATASQLANIATATRNLVGGTALNIVALGPGRTVKALVELISDYRAIMAEGVRIGALGKDIMNLFNDNDSREYHTKYAKFNDKVSRFASWSMSRSMYKFTENIIRATAMIAAKNYLTEGLHNINTKGMKNKEAIKFIAWAKRHDLNPTKLILEDGAGKETAKMLRKAVNIPQGSYRIDMTPMFVDTKWGRFLWKYQKFSTQVSRLFYKEYFQPLMDSINNPQYDGHAAHEMARTIGFVATGIFGGTLDAMIRMYVFGYMDRGPDPDDLLYTISQDKEASLKVAWLLDRSMNSLVNSGFLGIASTPIQGVTNLVNQRSVANPLDPPGVAVVTHLGQFLNKVVQTKGDMGHRDALNSIDQLWAMFRAYRRAGMTTLEAVGVEWQEVQYHSARKDQMYVRKVIGRWMRDNDHKVRRPQMEGVYRTPQSKFNQQVYEAIATGRPEKARIIIREYLKGKPKSERDDIKRSLSQSVRNRQPMTFGGTQNNNLEKEFKTWLRQGNLPEHSTDKIFRVQRDYERNAKRAGVL